MRRRPGVFGPCASLRAAGGALALSAFDRVRALAGGRPIFTAAYYVYDPINDDVSALIDWNDPTHLLQQTGQTWRAVVPTPHADFNGQLALAMVGDVWYTSSRPASYWSIVQLGGDVYDLTTPITVSTTQICWETTNNFSTPYVQRYWATSNVQVGARPQPSPVANTTLVLSGAVAGTPKVARTRVVASGPTLFGMITAVTEQSGALAAAPDATSPSRGLGLGRNGLPNNFRFAFLYFFPTLSVPDRATVEAQILTTYGVAT